MKLNPLHLIDFYKANHFKFYGPETEFLYNNFTPRSTKYLEKIEGTDDKIALVGLQYFIKYFLIDTWNSEFFNKPKEEVVRKYKRRMDNSLGVDAVSTKHISDLHDLGYLPIKIKSLPEGSAVNAKIPFFTVKNTVKGYGWLSGYLEDPLSCLTWKTATSATIARKYKQIGLTAAKRTGVDVGFVDFQFHDFQLRGCSGPQDAVMSGAGHLMNFVGTDNVPAIDFLEDYYNANSDIELVGCSVYANEHSCVCSGKKENEFANYEKWITKTFPNGILSLVSDTWSLWNVITNYLPRLKDVIMTRDGKVVIRPDSSPKTPLEIICGDCDMISLPDYVESLDHAKEYTEDVIADRIKTATSHGECGDRYGEAYFNYDGITYKIVVELDWSRYDKQYYYVDDSSIKSCEPHVLTPEQKGCVQLLWEIFGGTINEAGFKVLDPHIGLLYGEAITLQLAGKIFKRLEEMGFASSNVLFGIGSFSYEYRSRDTLGWACKATASVVDGEFREIFKDPITDDHMKKSAQGLLRVDKIDGEFVLKDQCTAEEEAGGELKTVFENSKLIVNWTLAEIRETLSNS